ncbi:hypothetical protein [Stenotrophomonas sp. PS02289]|uniref:hypothetical protein n=1 Tax=Stenotrophomonas sp. PS02289 TaxID=2991422 RepID=UPI00249B50C7|nr:hypothetical protein [Stenotrophomonas sp. PS02289]
MAFRTPPYLSASLALHLLGILRESSGEPLRLEELLTSAFEAMGVDAGEVRYRTRTWNEINALAADILADYGQLGIVLADGGEEPRYYAPAGNGPPGRPLGPDAQGPGDGGSGMAEVLAHPVLFSVPKEDFEAAISRALESY